MKLTSQTVDGVLEIYYNQTTDYDVIADQMNIAVLDVANIINEHVRLTQKAEVIE